MKYDATSPQKYIDQLPEDRKEPFSKLRDTILNNLPDGFAEEISYGMIGYVIPKEKYPAGYHVNPDLPLPFISIASQKNFIALYHFGIYADTKLHDWFISNYPHYSKTKPDMGKSCIRFKNTQKIPFDLIGELVTKLNPDQWIQLYESSLKNSGK